MQKKIENNLVLDNNGDSDIKKNPGGKKFDFHSCFALDKV